MPHTTAASWPAAIFAGTEVTVLGVTEIPEVAGD